MSANPYESSEVPADSELPKSKPSFSVVHVLLVVAIVGVLVALLIPNRRGAREAARRMQCSNHLKQITIALQNYEDVYKCFPPAYTVDEGGKPLHSWRTLILAYIEPALYDKIDLSKPWNDPANKAAYETTLSVYRCPSGNAKEGQTTYLAVVAPGGCFQPAEPRRRAEITDNPDLTLMVIEVASDHSVHWMSPNDADEAMVLSLATTKNPPHPNVALAAFVDGHIQSLSRDLEPALLRAMISIAGNDDEIAQAD